MTDAELMQQAEDAALDEPLDVRNMEPTIGAYLQAFFDRSKQYRHPGEFGDEPSNEQKEAFKRGGR
jgi:hypothetical protein